MHYIRFQVTDAALKLSSDIATVPGIGPRTRPLYVHLGIATVGDLIKHLPLRYERHLEEGTIRDADALIPQADGSKSAGVIAVRGEIAALRIQPGPKGSGSGPKTRIEATLEDETGRVRLVWFNAPWLRQKLHPGSRGLVQGDAKRFRGYLEMINPKWTPIDDRPEDAEPTALSGRLRPIYPASEELPTTRIEKAVDHVLDAAIPLIVDALPEPVRHARALLPLGESYRRMHRPESEEAMREARHRLAYDELLLLQLGVMVKRWHLRREANAKALALTPTIDERIRKRLPFTLTPDQDQVIAEIAKDLAQTTPMNRLLQGDVGSGKTAVAAYAMLMAVAHGAQAAILAPTEILAEQHVASLRAMLAVSGVRIELLTGGKRAKERTALLERLAAGEVDIVIGTHALLSEGVRFKDLAVVVIDEQHRFGVAQRATLRARAAGDSPRSPHVLVMTATPIPRTLALTVFGDLDVSTIRHSPPGRSPVTTRWVTPQAASEVYRWLAPRIHPDAGTGERAFIVVPAIDPSQGESETALADVTTHLAALRAGPLAGCRLAAMHGRLSAAERDDVMGRFRAGELDAIVATTVIEVGVDVPEATVMIVEHAERFGLAQLHQLRGRVGRGAKPGTCLLIGEPVTDEAQRRLQALVESTDGFRIAELDLEIRGPGELVGSRQSGLPPFRVADLVRDLELLRDARRDAADLVGGDPTLAKPEHLLLRKKLLHAYGEALGLVDVG
jgi:ATP-dependent DNA helicase RecG